MLIVADHRSLNSAEDQTSRNSQTDERLTFRGPWSRCYEGLGVKRC